MKTLTTENAHLVSTVISKSNPEWGNKRFLHNEQDVGCSLVGQGSSSHFVWESDYHEYNVASWK